MLSFSLPNGRLVAAACGMVIEKSGGVARRCMGNNEAWGTRSRGYPIGRLISGVGINAHRGTAEMDVAFEVEGPSVETQGENEYGSHR